MQKRLLHGLELTLGEDGLHRDEQGTIHALADEASMTDRVTRCGVKAASLPVSDEWTDACRAHDFAYSSPAYQRFHTRAEADQMLEDHLKLASTSRLRRLLAPAAAGVARIFGRFFWENGRTR